MDLAFGDNNGNKYVLFVCNVVGHTCAMADSETTSIPILENNVGTNHPNNHKKKKVKETPI